MTSHGAEYVFVGVADLSDSSTLDADSVFSAAICGGGSECTNAASVVLNETLPCAGKECGIGVSHVTLDAWSPHTTGLRVLTETHDRRQAFLEVETLVDHLFRHYYTPVNEAKRVIPRFVTSNPSPSYIRSVRECGPNPPPVAAAPQESNANVVTVVFKPIALRPVVTSFLVKAESSTGVDHGVCVLGHLDYSFDCEAVLEAVFVSNDQKCDVTNVFVDRNGHGSCSPGMFNDLIYGGGRKWTHLGTMFLILRVRVENGLHLH